MILFTLDWLGGTPVKNGIDSRFVHTVSKGTKLSVWNSNSLST